MKKQEIHFKLEDIRQVNRFIRFILNKELTTEKLTNQLGKLKNIQRDDKEFN